MNDGVPSEFTKMVKVSCSVTFATCHIFVYDKLTTVLVRLYFMDAVNYMKNFLGCML